MIVSGPCCGARLVWSFSNLLLGWGGGWKCKRRQLSLTPTQKKKRKNKQKKPIKDRNITFLFDA